MELTAYEIHTVPGFSIEPAPHARDWMDQTPNRFAYRCLPLVMANQFGWVIPCPATVDVRWNGRNAPGKGLVIEYEGGEPGYIGHYIQDHFGDAILTFSLPYLFRTPPGYGLLVRGPTNMWVPGAHPLDGFVEADWLESTFTMNWKLVEPGRTVRFEQGFPICQVLPYPRDLLESMQTRLAPLAENEELKARNERWSSSREQFNKDPERKPQDWQKDYFQGKNMTGELMPGHATRLKLGTFDRRSPE